MPKGQDYSKPGGKGGSASFWSKQRIKDSHSQPGNTESSGGYSKAHPGFKAVQSKIVKERGVSKERAGAILASASRGASAAAKKRNPRLKRV
jgi:hypothetical protein